MPEVKTQNFYRSFSADSTRNRLTGMVQDGYVTVEVADGRRVNRYTITQAGREWLAEQEEAA